MAAKKSADVEPEEGQEQTDGRELSIEWLDELGAQLQGMGESLKAITARLDALTPKQPEAQKQPEPQTQPEQSPELAAKLDKLIEILTPKQPEAQKQPEAPKQKPLIYRRRQ